MSKLKQCKGQISTEFVIIYAIFFVMFIILLALAVQNGNVVTNKQESEDAAFQAKRIADHMTAIFHAGDGAQTSFMLPLTVGRNTAYTVTIYPAQQIVHLQYGVRAHSEPLPMSEITGNLTFSSGQITVANIQDQLVITHG